MGMLISRSPEIERIKFVKFPTRATKVERMVRVNGTIFAKLGHRTVACSRDNLAGAWAFPANNHAFPWMDDVIEGLFRLGCISKEAHQLHLDRCKENGERQEREYAAERLLASARALGIDLTATQKRNLPKKAA